MKEGKKKTKSRQKERKYGKIKKEGCSEERKEEKHKKVD